MRAELAQALVELWDEYLASNTMTFQPTMTDFAGWLKDHQFGESVKSVRAEPSYEYRLRYEKNLTTPYTAYIVETNSENEPSGAQSMLGKPFKAAGKLHARKLRKHGHSLAAIQKILKEDGYVDVPLETIIRAVA